MYIDNRKTIHYFDMEDGKCSLESDNDEINQKVINKDQNFDAIYPIINNHRISKFIQSRNRKIIDQ
jgi:hypothetical protein